MSQQTSKFIVNPISNNTTGTAANVTASSNSTLTTLSVLSLPATQLSGTLQASQFPALTGDITTTAGALATTLATVNANVGTFGSASLVPTITVNAKGLITAVSTSAVVASAAANVVAKTTTYNANINDYILASSSAFVVTLPTAVGVSGQSIWLKKTDTSLANIITVNTTSAQTIDGSASGVITANTLNELYQFTSDGANWSITEHKTATGWVSGGTNLVSATSAYVFTLGTTHNATAGAVYNDGTNNYVVTTTIAAGSTLTCSGPASPATSGTLTKVSGTGDSTIVYSSRTITGQPVKGTNSTDSVRWRRQGSVAILRYDYVQTAVGSNSQGSGEWLWYLPTGMTADTTVVPIFNTSIGTSLWGVNTAQPSYLMMTGNAFEAAGPAETFNQMAGYLYSSNQFRIAVLASVAAQAQIASGFYALYSSSTSAYAFQVEVPISGWQP